MDVFCAGATTVYTANSSADTREQAMARRSIEVRLSQLDAQRKTLQARLGKQARAKDTRRKILLGALVLHRLETQGTANSPRPE